MSGKLYICPTPIGNLGDISLRTIETFKEVDYIAAEDTRHSGQLLKHLGINKPFISYHEHNKKSKGQDLLALLKSGKNLALVSDAGMPGISDPGQDMVRLCIEEDIEVTVLPGPSAFVNALVLSGLDTNRFTFIGFLPSKSSDRKKELKEIKPLKETLIIYESPHRILDSLKDIEEVLGNRNISISRELTKLYEETLRGQVSDLIEHFNKNKAKGEFVIILEGNLDETDIYTNLSIVEHLEYLIENGYSKKDAVKKIAEDRDIPKNLVYKESLNM